VKPTFCRDCDHVVEDTRKRSPHQWLCGRHKRLEGQGFVDPDLWIEMEPFLKCSVVNGGICLLFEPRRVNPDGKGLTGMAD
jgi:hypothetical protein